VQNLHVIVAKNLNANSLKQIMPKFKNARKPMVYTSRESKLIFLPINPYSYENLLISLGNED